MASSRLILLHDEIKAAQPKTSGAVCLEIYPCGEDRMIAINLSAKGTDPVLAVAKSAPPRVALLPLIREAKGVINARATLLAAICSVNARVPRQRAA